MLLLSTQAHVVSQHPNTGTCSFIHEGKGISQNVGIQGHGMILHKTEQRYNFSEDLRGNEYLASTVKLQKNSAICFKVSRVPEACGPANINQECLLCSCGRWRWQW